jgi:hypothetical protein
MYRITRTVIRGQFENDQCFVIWLAAQAGAVYFVKSADDPLNNGGPNDKRYYLWNQNQAVKTPTCPNSAPDLVVHAGLDGWESQAQAEAVLAYELGQSQVIADQVKAANEAAVSPEHLAESAAKDAGKALDAAGKALSSGGPWIVVGLVAVAAIAWKVLK